MCKPRYTIKNPSRPCFNDAVTMSSSSNRLLVSGVLMGIVVWAAIKLFQASRRPGPAYPLPPGPKGKPIVGNLGDLPPAGALEWEHWAKHKALYGMPRSPSSSLSPSPSKKQKNKTKKQC